MLVEVQAQSFFTEKKPDCLDSIICQITYEARISRRNSNLTRSTCGLRIYQPLPQQTLAQYL